MSPGSVITISGTPVSMAPGAMEIILGSSTHMVNLDSIIISTFGLPSRPTLTPVMIDSITIYTGSTAAVIGGSTYTFSVKPAPEIITADSVALTIGHSVILNIPAILTPVTIDGITLSINPSKVVVGGSTIAMGGPTMIVVGSKTLTILLPTTTAPILSPITMDDVTFSVNPSEAVISGTTHSIGPGASPRAVVIGSETIKLGSDGITFPSTTITTPFTSATGFEPFVGSADRLKLRDNIWVWITFRTVLMFLAERTVRILERHHQPSSCSCAIFIPNLSMNLL